MPELKRVCKKLKSKVFAFPIYKVTLGKLSATGLSEEAANLALDVMVTAKLVKKHVVVLRKRP